MSTPAAETCTCPHLQLGNQTLPERNWSDACPEHGVGTEYFANLPVMPFGYREERHTTREEWEAFLRGERS